MNIILRILLSALAVIMTTYILPGVHIRDFLSAIIVAVILAILNGILKPILVILTIPITILTLGLFLLVINAIIILLASSMVPGFYVDGFWWALLFSIILSVISYLLGIAATDKPSKS
ncbi:MAG: phage holin family protein [Bacteroidales bacterium]|nr:phage holin family protein [Bacteroidales bacterium]